LQNTLANVAYQWARKDSRAALAAANQLPAGPARQAFINSVVSEWAQKDPGAALNYALALPAGQARANVLGNVIGPVVLGGSGGRPRQPQPVAGRPAEGQPAEQCDYPASLSATAPPPWIMWQKMPAGLGRNRALLSVINPLAQEDPKLAASLAAILPRGSEQAQAYGTIASRYAATDSVAPANGWRDFRPDLCATSWSVPWPVNSRGNRRKKPWRMVEALATGNMRQSALGQIASTWAQNDLPGALGWVRACPKGR